MANLETHSRRRFLLGGAAVGAGALVSAGCTSNVRETGGNTNAAAKSGGSNSKPGKHVTIGFSVPAADHGWIAAIAQNATAQGDRYSDVTLQTTEGTNDVSTQIAAVQSLMDKKVDVLAILPFDGKALTQVAQQAMKQGFPVVNIDRIFSSKLAYRAWIGGDNYGMGVNAGNFLADRLEQQGKTDNPVIVEVAGIDNLLLTQQRSKGFKEALASHGLKVTARQAAEFTVSSGHRVMSSLLQANPHIDAVWNHDDDQGVGVEAAIKEAGRTDEFFMVGGAGSLHVMKEIKSGKSFIKATVLYPPSMSASAISLARLIGQGKTLSDLSEHDVPASITTFSAVVTKDNVDQYMEVGFS